MAKGGGVVEYSNPTHKNSNFSLSSVEPTRIENKPFKLTIILIDKIVIITRLMLGFFIFVLSLMILFPAMFLEILERR